VNAGNDQAVNQENGEAIQQFLDAEPAQDDRAEPAE